MHARTPRQKDALIPLINELYERIRPIEIEQGLAAGPKDFRPRIELFHDAIRAYTSGQSPYESTGRLTLERLAWDIETLRALQANPLQQLPGAQKLSAGQAVAIRHPQGRPDNRALRSELAGLYRNYTVFFAAILAETADMNHSSRMEEYDAEVEELARQGAKAKQAMAKIDMEQKKLEKLHLTWLAGQLAMYEEAKEVVQQLMQSGLNMAGRFLQEAMAQGGRGAGGRGY